MRYGTTLSRRENRSVLLQDGRNRHRPDHERQQLGRGARAFGEALLGPRRIDGVEFIPQATRRAVGRTVKNSRFIGII